MLQKILVIDVHGANMLPRLGHHGGEQGAHPGPHRAARPSTDYLYPDHVAKEITKIDLKISFFNILFLCFS